MTDRGSSGEIMKDGLGLRHDAPDRADFRNDVLDGLTARPKRLPSKYFYDDAGAELFERITRLEAYYPTRTELEILAAHGREMGEVLGTGCRIVEFGSGSAIKTERLLECLDAPAAYVPIDISRAQLVETAERIAARFPDLDVLPVCADYNRELDLPASPRPSRRTVVFFPGSTIGNLEPAGAVRFLARMKRLVGSGGAALIGVDRQKDAAIMERAYNDPEGVTAAFNLNLLHRINRELGAGFDLSTFEHRAVYDAAAGRVEMHLVSTCDQAVCIPDADGRRVEIAFDEGEWIVTEHSYKYTLEGFANLAEEAGLGVRHVWSDARELFSIILLRC